MKMLGSRLFRLVPRGLCIVAASFALAAPAGAGVVDGVKTVDGLTVYLGVVPAAVTRGHAPQHTESTMHGGAAARRSIHDVHLLVAVFNSASGQRLRNVKVTARIHGAGRNLGTVPLTPMTVNGALTYGGYAKLGWEEDVMILVDIRRPGRTPRTSTTTAQFEYAHD
jgi:hypothetical protein